MEPSWLVYAIPAGTAMARLPQMMPLRSRFSFHDDILVASLRTKREHSPALRWTRTVAGVERGPGVVVLHWTTTSAPGGVVTTGIFW